MNKHPGGSFMIEQTVGRDISKYFYGGHFLGTYAVEQNNIQARHCHSNIARIIACDLAIA